MRIRREMQSYAYVIISCLTSVITVENSSCLPKQIQKFNMRQWTRGTNGSKNLPVVLSHSHHEWCQLSSVDLPSGNSTAGHGKYSEHEGHPPTRSAGNDERTPTIFCELQWKQMHNTSSNARGFRTRQISKKYLRSWLKFVCCPVRPVLLRLLISIREIQCISHWKYWSGVLLDRSLAPS